MIDDKKIEAAKEEIYEDRFMLNGEEIVFDNDAKEEMFYKEDIKEAIGLGAKWAINEILKDLWHDIFNERIPHGKRVIVEYTCDGGIYYRSIKIPDDIQWVRGFSCENRLMRWLYIDDLFPKEGGGEQ